MKTDLEMLTSFMGSACDIYLRNKERLYGHIEGFNQHSVIIRTKTRKYIISWGSVSHISYPISKGD